MRTLVRRISNSAYNARPGTTAVFAGEAVVYVADSSLLRNLWVDAYNIAHVYAPGLFTILNTLMGAITVTSVLGGDMFAILGSRYERLRN
jgi:hypothetical protein